MDNAKRLAAETGFSIYLSAQPRPSLVRINDELLARGMVEVRDRTYRHYRSLDHWGQKSYLPINEFDIAVKHHNIRKAS